MLNGSSTGHSMAGGQRLRYGSIGHDSPGQGSRNLDSTQGTEKER